MKRSFDITSHWPDLDYVADEVRQVFSILEETSYLVPPGDVSIVFMNDEELAELHERFLNDPTPTDVITFEGDVEMGFAGEICVSAERALLECEKQEQPFPEELTLYLVHGWLHLTGLDDIEEDDRPAMRAGEKALMRLLIGRKAIPRFAIH